MITREDIEAMVGYEYFTPRFHAKPKTVMGMVQEYGILASQKPDPKLYSRLVAEEFKEWLDSTSDIEELKELADLVYVIYGYANAKGWDLDTAVQRVHDNNVGRMRQPDGTIKRREDGKILRNQDFPKVELGDLV